MLPDQSSRPINPPQKRSRNIKSGCCGHNMNLAVEEPSKIIKMKIGNIRCCRMDVFGKGSLTDSSQVVPEQSLTGEPENICAKEASRKHTDVSGVRKPSIDFFSLNENEMPFSGTKALHMNRNVEGKLRNGNVFREEFIRTALRNDIRVKNSRYIDGLVFVYFYTLDDSISFYKQFSPYADMHFSHRYDFERLSLLSSEWQNVDLHADDFLDDPPTDGLFHLEHIGKSGSSASAVADDILKTKMHFHSSSSVDVEAPKPTLEVIFNKKVEYFSSLKNFFSKSDVKVMMQNLEMGSVEFVFKNTKELAVGNQTNKVMQEAIKMLSEVEIAKVIENLTYDIAPIAANKHGAYTVQMLIAASNTTLTQGLLSKYFREFGGFLITHEIGNYAVQKILRFDPDLIFGFFMSNIANVTASSLGTKVLKRCLKFFSNKKALLEKVQKYMDKDLKDVL